MRRRYTEIEKQTGVALAVVHGQRPAAEQMGVPVVTLHQWYHDPKYERLRTETRETVAEAMWVTVQRSLDRLGELVERSDDLKAVAVAFGVVYDKHALMTGSATSRTESRDITGTLADADIAAAISAAQALVSGTPAKVEEPTEG